MYTNNTNPIGSQPHLPCRELWQALLLIFNYCLLPELAVSRDCPEDQRAPGPVVEAIQFLDCCLDIALKSGWIEDANRVD
jgi:hypothetical protein